MEALRPVPLLLALLVALGPGPAGRPAEAADKPGVPDKALKKRIDQAIARGADYLRSIQGRDGSIGGVSHSGQMHYEIGATALAGLALRAAGEKPGDPGVDRALAYCRDMDANRAGAGSRTTYDTGTLLMFVTAYHRPQEKAGRRPRRPKPGDNPCGLPEAARKWVRNMSQWLGSVQEVDGGWGYPRPREDLSNTQYALLGLRAARDCGGTVPGRAFKRVVQRLLAIQEQEGPKVMRTVGGERKGERTYKIRAGDRARGWSYLVSPFNATGSMTTAGISSLAICHDALTEPKRLDMYSTKDENAVRRSIQDGFAWLDLNFTVTENPGRNAPAWHFYYLYGLERAAMLAGRPLIGANDWYLDGARYLVGRQAGDGRWSTGALGGKEEYAASDTLDTAWAILFLEKATRPLKPIPGPVITETGPPEK